MHKNLNTILSQGGLIKNIENNIPHAEENKLEGISTETIINVTLSPEVGVSIDDKHHIIGGVNLKNELGVGDFPADVLFFNTSNITVSQQMISMVINIGNNN